MGLFVFISLVVSLQLTDFCLDTGVPRLCAGFGTSAAAAASLAYSWGPMCMRFNCKMVSTSSNKIKLVKEYINGEQDQKDTS